MKAILFIADWNGSSETAKKTFNNVVSQLRISEKNYEILNVEDEDGLFLSRAYKVRNVPTILITRNDGTVFKEFHGRMRHEELKSVFEKHVR